MSEKRGMRLRKWVTKRNKGACGVWVKEMESFSCSGLLNGDGSVKEQEKGQIFPFFFFIVLRAKTP